jgi:ATP-dependent DNA helicase RecQ
MSAAMEQYAKSAECRRKLLLKYFGEDYPKPNCASCDNCIANLGSRDFTREARWFAKALRAVKEKFGANILVEVLRGANTGKLRSKEHMFRSRLSQMECYGSLKDLKTDYVKGLVQLFRSQGILEHHFVGQGQIKVCDRNMPNAQKMARDSSAKQLNFLSEIRILLWSQVYRLGPLGHQLLRDPNHVIQPIKIPSYLQKHLPSSQRPTPQTRAELDAKQRPKEERDLATILLKLRTEIARSSDCAPYMVMSKQAIDCMAKYRPIDKPHIHQIPGVGNQRAADFGGSHTTRETRIVSLCNIGKPNANPIGPCFSERFL